MPCKKEPDGTARKRILNILQKHENKAWGLPITITSATISPPPYFWHCVHLFPTVGVWPRGTRAKISFQTHTLSWLRIFAAEVPDSWQITDTRERGERGKNVHNAGMPGDEHRDKYLWEKLVPIDHTIWLQTMASYLQYHYLIKTFAYNPFDTSWIVYFTSALLSSDYCPDSSAGCPGWNIPSPDLKIWNIN